MKQIVYKIPAHIESGIDSLVLSVCAYHYKKPSNR